MKVHAITTSVDYSAELAQSIDRWIAVLASLTVVTCARDHETQRLAESAGARLLVTEAFFEAGAHFNKGKALQQARELLPEEDWHLFVDADVVPPVDWLERVAATDPRRDVLHGARRRYEDGRPIHDAELAGFFQLFHSSDPRAAAPLASDFTHAGCYDSDFMLRWPRRLQRILDVELVHLGEPGRNWCGRGNESALEEIRRRRRTRSWRDERIGR